MTYLVTHLIPPPIMPRITTTLSHFKRRRNVFVEPCVVCFQTFLKVTYCYKIVFCVFPLLNLCLGRYQKQYGVGIFKIVKCTLNTLKVSALLKAMFSVFC